MKNSVRLALLSSAVIGFLASCGGGNTEQKPPVDSTATQNQAPAGVTKDFTVDTAASVINWKGTKTNGEHKGTLKIKSGTVKVANGKLAGGSFVLDMMSITVTDLTGKEKADLEGHLKNKDFFEADKFAEGKFEITGVEGDKVNGNLTLKDKTNPVSFTATVTATETEMTANAPMFTIDRQQWGVNYQSKMKDVVIANEMGIEISLKGK